MTAGGPVTYEVRVAGHLDDRWSAWFGCRALVRDDDGTTTLTLDVADQAQLHGVLAGVHGIGIAVISVTIVAPSTHAGHGRGAGWWAAPLSDGDQ